VDGFAQFRPLDDGAKLLDVEEVEDNSSGGRHFRGDCAEIEVVAEVVTSLASNRYGVLRWLSTVPLCRYNDGSGEIFVKGKYFDGLHFTLL
jgi:hypothetical protein